MALSKTRRVKYEGQIILFDNMKIIFVPKNIIKNKIIFIDDLSCFWHYTKSISYVTGKPEILQIEITPKTKDKKVQIVAKTLGKLEITNPNNIKIFDVKE